MTKKRIMLGTAAAGFVALLIAALTPTSPAAAQTPQQALAAALAGQYSCTMVDQVNGFTLTCVTPGGTPSPSTSASASVTPTVSPSGSTTTPAPSASTPAGGNNCQTAPGRCGFPDALSTGPTSTAGTTVLNGNQTYTVANATIANTTINGCTVVRAAGVTFRNVRFNANGCFWGVQSLSSGLSIVDSEITCGGANGTAIGSNGFALLRADIHNCENGMDVGSNASLVDSWIHDMETDGGAHTDGAQIGQGSHDLLFRHNTIAMASPGATSAIISWDEGGTQQQRVVIDGNLMSGGTYTVYCPRQGTSDTRVTNNRFGTFEFGYANDCVGSHVSAWSGNVRDSNGAALAAA